MLPATVWRTTFGVMVGIAMVSACTTSSDESVTSGSQQSIATELAATTSSAIDGRVDLSPAGEAWLEDNDPASWPELRSTFERGTDWSGVLKAGLWVFPDGAQILCRGSLDSLPPQCVERVVIEDDAIVLMGEAEYTEYSGGLRVSDGVLEFVGTLNAETFRFEDVARR